MATKTKEKKTLFCSVTDLSLDDLDQDQMDKIHFRVFCSFAITRKIDLTRMTNHESHLIDQAMDGDKWLSHAITHGIIYHA
jgi:hypothetical protein